MRLLFSKLVLIPLYSLYFFSIFMGQTLYFFHSQLHFIRIIPLILICVLFFYFRKNRIKLSFSNPYIVLLLAAAFYFIYSVEISLVHYEYFNLNSFLNFSLLIILIVSIIFLFYLDGKRALSVLVKVALFFYIISIVIAYFEIITGHHFYLSAANFDDRIKFTPSVFFVNTNDFCAVHILTGIFLISVLGNNARITYLSLILFFSVVSFLIYYLANARLAMLVMIFTMFYNFWGGKLKLIAISGIALVIFFILLPDYVSMMFNRFENFSFNQEILNDVSAIRRFNLYAFGLLSMVKSYGFGFGIDASSHYFESLNELSLDGLVNPHGYLIEILINGGLFVFIGYIFLMVYLVCTLSVLFRCKFIFFLLLYNLILFSSSSSLFLWPHYLIFFAIWYYYFNKPSFFGYKEIKSNI